MNKSQVIYNNDFGHKMSQILTEIETNFLERNSNPDRVQPKYSNEAFRAAIYIFMELLMDKMFSLQSEENMDIKSRAAMAEKAGKELSKFVHTYTGINTLKLFVGL